MNVIISTCPRTKEKTIIPISSKIKVDGMKGESELTIKPKYLCKEVCQSLAATIRESPHLRQYFQKRIPNDNTQPGWEEPRLMILFHEDSSSFDLTESGPGYGYRDVRICGIPYDAIPGLQTIADQFAKECGVPGWNLGVNAVFLTNGRDKVGWHSDQQGEEYVGCIILDNTEVPRPVKIKEKVKRGNGADFASLSLQLGVGSYYCMNGAMQNDYVHTVPRKNGSKPPSLSDARLSLVFRHGIAMNAKDNGDPASLQSRLDQVQNHVSVKHGVIDGVDELDRFPLTFLQASFAHRVGVKGVNGNMTDDCDAIIVAKNNLNLDEEDSE